LRKHSLALRGRLASLEPEVYKNYLKQSLFEATGDTGGERYHVRTRPVDNRVKEIVAAVNATLAKANSKGRVRLADTSGDFIGGFVPELRKS